MNHRQKKMGYNAAEIMKERVIQRINENKGLEDEN